MAKAVTGTSGGAFGSYTSNNTSPLFAAVPPSGVAAFNETGVTQTVVVTGGTLSAVTVNGASVGTGGTYTVPRGQAIALTYTGSPSWSWSAPVVFTKALNSDGSPVAKTGHGG
jgi:hypothetical protein